MGWAAAGSCDEAEQILTNLSALAKVGNFFSIHFAICIANLLHKSE
jgi:hypothetical protein